MLRLDLCTVVLRDNLTQVMHQPYHGNKAESMTLAGHAAGNDAGHDYAGSTCRDTQVVQCALHAEVLQQQQVTCLKHEELSSPHELKKLAPLVQQGVDNGRQGADTGWRALQV